MKYMRVAVCLVVAVFIVLAARLRDARHAILPEQISAMKEFIETVQ